MSLRTFLSTKYISDVLLVLKVSQSLFSVGGMIEKNRSLVFEKIK